jgi:phosphohistidine phosphatase
MRVLLIRHAIAEDRDHFAQSNPDDNMRPLLPKGRKKMRTAVKGMLTLIPQLNLIVSSPLIRALETATLVHEHYHEAQFIQLNALAPGQNAQEVTVWLQKQNKDATIALIGHEPDLGQLATWLLAGNNVEPFVGFKKGAMMLLEFPYKVGAARAQLCWMLSSAHLRALAS